MNNDAKEWYTNIVKERILAKEQGMCELCCPESSLCEIYKDTLTNDWYMSIKTGEWDSVEEEYVYIREYINYCPFCGRKL